MKRDSVRYNVQVRTEATDRLKRLHVEAGALTRTRKSDALCLADAVAGAAATALP
jgi:hypothetical protein